MIVIADDRDSLLKRTTEDAEDTEDESDRECDRE